MNLFLAFLTGITTGGLSCMAVQGGLLASSLAGQIEKDMQTAAVKTGRKSAKGASKSRTNPRTALPILAFLLAKLLAYTLLGFLLGLAGQVFQLSPLTRAVLQIGIGVFMLGSALRMLNVHPIFRYFAFEPPAALRRWLRRRSSQASDDASLAAPIFLGFLTVLIPCGVTQAMMAVALGSGDPLQGAALMFAFTLGTSPVFFALAYFATQLGAKLEKNFMRLVAIVILVMAVITIDSGITLAGSPVSLSRMVSSVFASRSQPNAAPALQSYLPVGPAQSDPAGQSTPSQTGSDSLIRLDVKNNGYEPNILHARAGVPLQLELVTENVRSCSRAFTIPKLGVEKVLDATGSVLVDIPAQPKGTKMPFSCSMGMYTGTIVFDL